MITKTCKKCLVEKELLDFPKNGSKKSNGTPYYFSECKNCRKEKRKKYDEKYRKNNKEKIILVNKNYIINNKKRIIEYNKKYRDENKNIIKFKRKLKSRENRVNNLFFKLKNNISRAVRHALNKNNSSKNGKSLNKYLPYSIEDFKTHIESLFEPWMTWNNYGIYNSKTWNDNDSSTWTWQIDHIIPHSTFKYTSMEDDNFKKCWSLENLRPYSSKQNFFDGINRVRHMEK